MSPQKGGEHNGTELNEDDRIALKMWVGAGKTEQRLARRAQVRLSPGP